LHNCLQKIVPFSHQNHQQTSLKSRANEQRILSIG
jgi:hypothetical protein